MLTVKEWMELVDFRITEGSDYCWRCFGDNPYSLSSWNGDHDGWSFNIVFDTKTQVVYTMEVCDYARSRAYRMINPDYKFAHDQEAKQHNVSAKEAWDECDFVDLEEDDDFIQKALAIRDGVDYDTRVSVPLTVPDDVLFELMKKAHEQDITLNQLVEDVLWTAIRAEELKSSLEEDDSDGWDELAQDHWDDDGEDMFDNLEKSTPTAAMKAKKKKKKSK
jgi:hypothetical protein